MLFILMLHITRRFLKQHGITIDFKQVLNRLLTGLKYGVPFLLISFNSSDMPREFENLNFEIMKKDRKLGYVNLQMIKENNLTKYAIKSEVNTKLVFNFSVRSEESYVYQGDTMIYSSIYRTVNKRVKVDQTIEFKNGSYQLVQKGRHQNLNTNIIRCNLVKLFFEKPKYFDKVFCDKQQISVNIYKLSSDIYKVNFPDNSYTIFYYEANRCKMIEAVGTFYHVSLIPKYSI